MKSSFYFVASKTIVFALLLSLVLSGCWSSKKTLFDESSFVDPFGNSGTYVMENGGKEKYLAVKTGNGFIVENNRDSTTLEVGFAPIDFNISSRDLSFYLAIVKSNKVDDDGYRYYVFAMEFNHRYFECDLYDYAKTGNIGTKTELLQDVISALKTVRDDISNVCKHEGKVRRVTKSDINRIRESFEKQVRLYKNKINALKIEVIIPDNEFQTALEINPIKDENAIFYECAGQSLAVDSGVSDEFCQCENDQALSKMTSQDWLKYSRDYSAFSRLNSEMDRSTPYKEKLAFINSNCMTCQARNYKGCLRGSDSSTSTENLTNLISNVEHGQFDLVKKDHIYKTVFTHLVRAYSHSCPSYVQKPRVKRTVVKGPNLGSYMYIEDEIKSAFDRYGSDLATSLGLNVVSEAIAAINRGDLPLGGFGSGLNMLQTSKKLDQILGSSCKENSRLSKAYTNIVRYEKGLSPIVPNGKIERKSNTHIIDRDRIQRVANRYISQEMARNPDGPLKCKYYPADLASPPAIQSKINKDYLVDFVGTYKTYIADLNGTEVHIALWPTPSRSIIGSAYFSAAQCVVPVKMKIYYGDYIQLKIDSGGGGKSCSKKISPLRLIEDGIFIQKESSKDVSWKMFETNFLERKLENCQKAIMPLHSSRISSEAINAMKEEHELRFVNYPNHPLRKDESFWRLIGE